jgi:hypothetical protein
VNRFLTEIGIRRLTDCIEIKSQTENFRPCPSLQSYVRRVVPWIQRQLYADEFREIYDYLTESGIKARLAAMTFAQVISTRHVYCSYKQLNLVIAEAPCRQFISLVIAAKLLAALDPFGS